MTFRNIARRSGRVVSTAALAACLLSSVALAQSSGGGRMTGLKLSGDQPIQIESDKLEVKQNENMAVFTGNVNVVQGATNLKSGKMVVYYAANNNGGGETGGSGNTSSSSQSGSAMGSSEIDRIEVDNNVYVRSEGQVATGDAGTFNMKTEELVLTGKEVVLTEGENVVTGCRLTVQMATGLAQLDPCQGGRVQMLLKPQQQN